jgi:ATP-binding cassette subfamily A (ABC1) protein 3
MRKLQLAISFVGGSKVCVIDEASSGLDPLSRRNIWNIIQKGHSLRTVLVTTHFLDEADLLSDHIAIMYKGKMVCEGSGTSLKSRFGDDYVIRPNFEEGDDAMVWRTSNSTDATRKLLELESLTEDSTYNVAFPTLEQVFLKVTSDSNTAVHESTGDGIVGEEAISSVIDEKIWAMETEYARDIDLDVGHTIGVARQIMTLFKKRYTLLTQKSGWISYGINLIIPIIIASALAKFIFAMNPLQTCQENQFLEQEGIVTARQLQSPETDAAGALLPLSPFIQSTIFVENGSYSAIVGPFSEFSGPAQDALYLSSISNLIGDDFQDDFGLDPLNATALAELTFGTRLFVNDTNAMISAITNTTAEFDGFGIFAPTPETATLFYSTNSFDASIYLEAFSLITNRIGNSTTTNGIARQSSVELRYMIHAEVKTSFLALPISLLITLAFITASSVAVIYPTFEKVNRVRALQYCNGVSPFALWLAYLIFDLQFILVQAFFVWGLLFAGSSTSKWYGSSEMLGVFILFGIASYLGNYAVSLFVKKAAFAISAGIHVLLTVLYLIGYVINQAIGDKDILYQTYTSIQNGLGLSSPGANLARALFLATDSFGTLCGEYGTTDTSKSFAYSRFGSIYTNLVIQIIFLIGFLAVYEYGSADWIRRNITHRGMPSRLHYHVDTGNGIEANTTPRTELEKIAAARAANASDEILKVSKVTKYFGKLFATQNISFNIKANETLALLGGNGVSIHSLSKIYFSLHILSVSNLRK